MSPRPPKVHILDFETEGIRPRPLYPPKPVGFSLKSPGDRKARYYAWGHPTENNCTFDEAQRVLLRVWNSGEPILGQNMKFDQDVAQEHMGCGSIHWSLVHDTLYLLFLENPHATTHSLKPSAYRLLGMAPEEQEAVRDWLMAHQDDLKAKGLLPLDVKLSTGKSPKPSPSGHPQAWGAYICLAPGKLVGAYSDGDVVRTELLFKKLWPMIVDAGMLEAYDRERELMPILLQNEREGVRADAAGLERDSKLYRLAVDRCDDWIRRSLRTKDLNVDSDDALADALVNSGKADPDKFAVTETGKRSVAKESLIGAVVDPRVLAVLQYRGKVGTFVSTFMLPWAREASGSGLVYPSWNQVRQHGGKGNEAGARTGRMSASRFMNTPKEVEEYTHPKWIKDLPPIPFVRGYLLPDKRELWGKRDYSQQEFRILAHYEDGNFLAEFNANPDIDVHVLVAGLINRDRKTAKNIGFGLLYGMGIGQLAERLKVDATTAKALKAEYLRIIPGIRVLQDELRKLAANNQPLRTWGGRCYYCEEPRIINGRKQTYEYKMLNYLIQGSAADCTKQAIINYHKARQEGRFLLTVHDEINISVPQRHLKSEMAVLRQAMADVAFDVPMLSDGKYGTTWGELQAFKEK